MSLATWTAEFYPTPASEVPADQAVAHSLRKWEGLRKENLERHGLARNGRVLLDDLDSFIVADRTCALCVHHREKFFIPRCDTCPLKAHLGHPCDLNVTDPYMVWCDTGDPLPMIAALRACESEVQA